jgi:hypothetical protein
MSDEKLPQDIIFNAGYKAGIEERENLEHRLQVVGNQARYYKGMYLEAQENWLERAACVVDTACKVDPSLRKLAQAIRDLKSE